jgi:hypothetical protein
VILSGGKRCQKGWELVKLPSGKKAVVANVCLQ